MCNDAYFCIKTTKRAQKANSTGRIELCQLQDKSSWIGSHICRSNLHMLAVVSRISCELLSRPVQARKVGWWSLNLNRPTDQLTWIKWLADHQATRVFDVLANVFMFTAKHNKSAQTGLSSH